MDYQTIFKRHELKYLLTSQQKELALQAMSPYMEPDRFGHTTIRNLYFDTDNFQLARHSIEHPVYKEKLRVRSYKKARTQDPVFVELKKKYHSVVYKRRLFLPACQASGWLSGSAPSPLHTQVADEVDYFCSHYEGLHPVVFLSYERDAFYSKCDDSFRVTFDENILAREDTLSLGEDAWGEPLLDDGLVLMEIKTAGGIPLWMSHFLAREHLYKTSFSKYGTAYRTMLYPDGMLDPAAIGNGQQAGIHGGSRSPI